MADRHRHDDLNTPMIVVVGVVGAIMIFAIIVALQGWIHKVQDVETYKRQVSWTPEQMAALHAKQQGELNGYRWIDRQAGVVAIPIDLAMDLVVQEIGKSVQAGEP